MPRPPTAPALGPPVLLLAVLALLLSACAPTTPATTPTSVPAAKPADPGPTAASAPRSTPANVGASAAPAGSAGPATVRVSAILDSVAARSVFIGEEKGYYAEQGLQLETVNLAANEALPQLAVGRLDAAVSGIGPAFFNAQLRGVDVKVVADVSILRAPAPGVKNAFWTVVRGSLADEVQSVADLKGRKIGVIDARGLNRLNLDRMLAYGGLTEMDVDVATVPYPEQLAALTGGAIDAVTTIEPWIALAADRGSGVPLLDMGTVRPNTAALWLFYSAQFINERPDVAQRFMLAHLKSVRYAEDGFVKGINRDEVIQTFVKHTGLKDPALYDRMGISYNGTNGEINMQDLALQQQYYVAHGDQPRAVEVDSLVDKGFADRAVQVLGPYQ